MDYFQGGTFSIAADINDLGVVAGTADGAGTVVSETSFFENEECGVVTQPFIWTQRNGMKGLGTLGGKWDYGQWCDIPFYANGINILNRVVGGTWHMSYSFALSWTNAEGMTLFGDTWPTTWAFGVGNNGQIVGQTADWMTIFLGHAAFWKNGVQTDLGSLGGGANVWNYGSAANGVNDVGHVVGWSDTVPFSFSRGPIHALLLNDSGVSRDLGTLPGDTDSVAVKINLFGLVIGSSGNNIGLRGTETTVIGRPFIWSQRTGMRDLNTLIPQNAGWVLQSATDINVWRQIVGQGILNGLPCGFLLTPRNPFQLP